MLYFPGDHIQVLERHDQSRILPHSLGFVYYFHEIGTNSLVGAYNCLFYRIGKNGMPRILAGVKQWLPLLDSNQMAIDSPAVRRISIGTHTVIKLGKLDLLKCEPIVFIGYLLSKILALYEMADKLPAHFGNKSIINGIAWTFDDVLALETRECLTTNILLNNNQLVNKSYVEHVLTAINTSGIKALLLKKYSSIDRRKEELRGLQLMYAHFVYLLKHDFAHTVRILAAAEEKISLLLSGLPELVDIKLKLKALINNIKQLVPNLVLME